MTSKRQLNFAFDLPDDPYALLDPGVENILPTNRLPAFDQLEEQQRQKLQKALSLLCGTDICLILNDNASRLVSVRRDPAGILVVRLHHMFLEASPEEVTILARFILTGDKKSSGALDKFIAEHSDEIAPATPRSYNLSVQGQYHNLQELFDYINLRYFQNTIHATITWGRMVRRNRRKRMQMGCYCDSQKLIRIHPALDQAFVPSYYVAWVIYHEMLHAHFGVNGRNAITGRRIIHPAKLTFAEKDFEYYEKAHLWEAQNINKLMKF